MNKTIYTGNGTTPVDSGLPNVGRIFAIDAAGDLRWYLYSGQGANDPSGSANWHPNSGHAIGRGWQEFLHILGCGDGVVMAVRPDGDLLWYRYTGDGTEDRTGALGWDANSGNPIGNGFATFRHVFVLPQEGRTTSPAITLFGVEPNGDLRWYQYAGNGEADQSGALGWHANSGNVVGNGWADVQLIVGANVIFAINPEGALRWYSYHGHGENDPTGALGWAVNSGNQIGRGWQDFRDVTGGANDTNGFGTVLYAIDGSGDLRWYRYNGAGEQDPTGALGWATNSGDQIGNGW